MAQLHLQQRSTLVQCPLCREQLGSAPLSEPCGRCGTVIHTACRALLGARPCASLGCAGGSGSTEPVRGAPWCDQLAEALAHLILLGAFEAVVYGISRLL